MTTLGTLEILRRYPVKSMAGEDLAQVKVAFTGLAGDRVWAFVRKDKKPDFPWHSAREQHDMLLYKTRFVEPDAVNSDYPMPAQLRVEVTTPDGARLSIDDPKLVQRLNAAADAGVELRFSEKGMQDARPVSLFALKTVAALAEESGVPIDHRQFRANFYVKWSEAQPAFFEDGLVGKTLKIGDTAEFAVVKKDPRCIIITLDPETATPQPAVLRHVARKHSGFCGVYLAVLRVGGVRQGDHITLLV